MLLKKVDFLIIFVYMNVQNFRNIIAITFEWMQGKKLQILEA